MLSWGEFVNVQPEMAAFGETRLKYGVSYLATIRPDGYPRVHPFTPFEGSGHLFAFMEPTSPKGKDLRMNGKYSIHTLVTDMGGTNGEFQITGEAFLLSDPDSRNSAVAACPYPPKDRYVLFEFKIERCFTNFYSNGTPNSKHWQEPKG